MTGYPRLGGNADSQDSVHLEVPVERLDDQGLDDVRFVEIDVEGHELEVLRGGANLLRRDRPTLLVEIEQRHLGAERTVADVVSYLRDLGYGAQFRTGRSTWADVTEFDPERHQRPDAVGRTGYVSMFLFRPVPPGETL